MAGIPLNVTRTHISSQAMDDAPASTNVNATISRVGQVQIDTASAQGERAYSDRHSTSNNIYRPESTAGTSCSGRRSFSNNVSENNTLDQQTSNVTSFVEEMHIDSGRVRDTTSHKYGSGSGADAVADAGVSSMVVDLEIPSVLPTNTERPFTYLADLSQKWAVIKDTMHFVQGRIKVQSTNTT